MPRRKEFKGIANNLACWCLSRNNDYLGYWAIGHLYSFSQKQKVTSVTIDVLAKHIAPENREFTILCSRFYELVQTQMRANSIPSEWLKSLQIEFRFDAPFQHRFHSYGSVLAKPMICKVVITTDLERLYEAESGCNCWPHNPVTESRRLDF